jgi:hypothetical protein
MELTSRLAYFVLLELPGGVGGVAPVADEPLAPVTLLPGAWPGPPLGAPLELPADPVLLPDVPLALEPLLLFCCRHCVLSVPVRPTH